MSHVTEMKPADTPRNINAFKSAVESQDGWSWKGWGSHKVAMFKADTAVNGFLIEVPGINYGVVMHHPDVDCEEDILPGGKLYRKMSKGELEFQFSLDDMYMRRLEPKLKEILGQPYQQAVCELQAAVAKRYGATVTKKTLANGSVRMSISVPTSSTPQVTAALQQYQM